MMQQLNEQINYGNIELWEYKRAIDAYLINVP